MDSLIGKSRESEREEEGRRREKVASKGKRKRE